MTNDHHFRVEVFYMIIDLQLQELNTRFNEISTSLLICTASLSPVDAFCSFDKQKLLKLAEFYPKEFSSVELLALDSQPDTYIHDVRKEERFIRLKNIGELSIKLVELNKHESFDLVYLLIKLVLILPVATASVERVFSCMNFVKNKLRNSIGNQMLNDSLVTFIEKEIFSTISDDDIVNRFQNMSPRKEDA
ncbi:zinc finger MYM-type protein 1-like protein [Tanacetum coccineum]